MKEASALTEPVPTDAARARLIALSIAGGVVLLAAAALGLWALLDRPEGKPAQRTIEPAQPTTTTPLPGVAPSASAEPTPSATSSVSPAPDSQPGKGAAVMAPRVGFLRDGTLYVGDVTGGNLVPVNVSGRAYAISPDGTKVAVVVSASSEQLEDSTSVGRIAVVDLATSEVTMVGAEALDLPVAWAPDGTWLTYTAQGADGSMVRRVNADGTKERVVARSGSAPSISRDGRYLVYSAATEELDATRPLRLVEVSSGAQRQVPGTADGALAAGWGPDGRLYFTKHGESDREWEIREFSVGSSKSRAVGSVEIEPPAFALHDVRVSPDGGRVLLAASGDDHYSRLWVFETDPGRFSAIQTRRDAYPCCWADEQTVLYFEGNGFQGEPTSLVRINADGTGRRLIVTGAQR